MGQLHKVTAPDFPLGEKLKVENMNFTFFGGKRSQAPAVTSELWCGKDKEGVIWISVSAPNRPKIKFNIGTNDFHHWFHGDGTPYTAAEASTLYSNAYVKILENMVAHLMCTLWVEPEQKPQQGGGGQRQGGGGGNYGGNRSGGNSYGGGGGGGAPAAAGGFDDSSDIPF
jgi:uncharacterized membrane protein YgcG